MINRLKSWLAYRRFVRRLKLRDLEELKRDVH